MLDPQIVRGEGFQFTLCTIPKNGCSQWKRMIAKVRRVHMPQSAPADTAAPPCLHIRHLTFPRPATTTNYTQAMKFPPEFYLDEKTSHLTIHGTKYKYLPYSTKPKLLAALAAPHVVISRDPFTRVLSAYLNKVRPPCGHPIPMPCSPLARPAGLAQSPPDVGRPCGIRLSRRRSAGGTGASWAWTSGRIGSPLRYLISAKPPPPRRDALPGSPDET